MLWRPAVVAFYCSTSLFSKPHGLFFHDSYCASIASKLRRCQISNVGDGNSAKTRYKSSSLRCNFSSCSTAVIEIPFEDYTSRTVTRWDKESWRDALGCLDHPGFKADSVTYAALLRWCSNARTLSDGRQVHTHILKAGCERNLFLVNLLLQMYGKCGVLADAVGLFTKMHQHDLFSWTFIIAAYAEHSDYQRVMELFQQMQLEGVMPNEFTFLSLLSAFVNGQALAKGKQVHAYIVGCAFESGVVLMTALLNMYGKCGCLEVARVVFDEMSEMDIVSWNTMIAAYSQHGHSVDALQLFFQMKEESMLPNKVTLVSIIDACASQSSFPDSKIIHTYAVESSLDTDPVVGNALVNMYSKSGNLDAATRAFNHLSERNVVSWTSIIKAHSQHGHFRDALSLFHQMQLEGTIANKFTVVGVLSACSMQACLAEGKQVHTCIMGRGFESDVVVGNALLNTYSKCGSLEDTSRMFDKMSEKDHYSFTTMIGAHAQCGQWKEAHQVFEQMHSQGWMPNKITFVTILSAFSSHKGLSNCKQIHTHIVNGDSDLDVVMGTALVNMYSSCGSPEDARKVFNKLPQRDGMLWNAIIAAYTQHNQSREALELFQQMQLEGLVPDKYTFVTIMDTCASHATLMESKRIHAQALASGLQGDLVVGIALINMYGKGGNVDIARAIFYDMFERGVVSWTAMIAVHVQHGQYKQALNIFLHMLLEGVLPNEMTYVTMLSACASQAVLGEGKRMHACIVGSRLPLDIVIGNALVNMYSKCGSLEDTKGAFDRMPDRNVVSWTAMISALSQHGQGKQALQVFQQMQQEGELPNQVTFIGILVACSHAGLVDEACCCFASMYQIYGISPTVEHFNCLIDLLGRLGQLDEVIYLIHSMPFPPTTTSWMILLGACRLHLDVNMAEFAADHVFKSEPENDAPYISLANIHAVTGSFHNADKVRRMMNYKGLEQG